MANPFQDQFLKAGLADKTKVEKAKRKQRKQSSQKIRSRSGEIDEAEKQRLQAIEQKAERDRELNRQKNEQAELKAITAQIRQLIELNSIEPPAESILFRFEDDRKIKQIEVDQKTQQQLVSGQLCIARLDERCYVIPRPVADKIIQRDERYIVLANEVDEAIEEDDEYADFQVPDDLMW